MCRSSIILENNVLSDDELRHSSLRSPGNTFVKNSRIHLPWGGSQKWKNRLNNNDLWYHTTRSHKMYVENEFLSSDVHFPLPSHMEVDDVSSDVAISVRRMFKTIWRLSFIHRIKFKRCLQHRPIRFWRFEFNIRTLATLILNVNLI